MAFLTIIIHFYPHLRGISKEEGSQAGIFEELLKHLFGYLAANEAQDVRTSSLLLLLLDAFLALLEDGLFCLGPLKSLSVFGISPLTAINLLSEDHVSLKVPDKASHSCACVYALACALLVVFGDKATLIFRRPSRATFLHEGNFFLRLGLCLIGKTFEVDRRR